MRRAALIAAGVLVALAAGSQLLLPGIAEDRLRDHLSRYGRVESVDISAFPALALMFGHADDVRVRMATYRSGQGRLAKFLARTRDVDHLDVAVRRLDVGPLALRAGHLRKRGHRISAAGVITYAELRSVLPSGASVLPVSSAGGQLVVEGSFGGFRARALLRPKDGHLVIQPDVPFGSALTLTVFEDPSVRVNGVGARRVRGGLLFSAWGRVT